MKKTTTHPINEKHFATVEFDGSQVLIYIEESYRIFFNLLPWSKQVSWCMLYRLVPDDENLGTLDYRYGCSINGFFAGRIQTLTEKQIKLRSFDLKSEINTLYTDYLKSLKSQQNTQKRIDNLINNL